MLPAGYWGSRLGRPLNDGRGSKLKVLKDYMGEGYLYSANKKEKQKRKLGKRKIKQQHRRHAKGWVVKEAPIRVSFTGNMEMISIYSRTSVARTPLGP